MALVWRQRQQPAVEPVQASALEKVWAVRTLALSRLSKPVPLSKSPLEFELAALAFSPVQAWAFLLEWASAQVLRVVPLALPLPARALVESLSCRNDSAAASQSLLRHTL